MTVPASTWPLTRLPFCWHPPLPLVGVSTVMERERQQNDRTLANGAGKERECERLRTGA